MLKNKHMYFVEFANPGNLIRCGNGIVAAASVVDFTISAFNGNLHFDRSLTANAALLASFVLFDCAGSSYAKAWKGSPLVPDIALNRDGHFKAGSASCFLGLGLALALKGGPRELAIGLTSGALQAVGKFGGHFTETKAFFEDGQKDILPRLCKDIVISSRLLAIYGLGSRVMDYFSTLPLTEAAQQSAPLAILAVSYAFKLAADCIFMSKGQTLLPLPGAARARALSAPEPTL